MVQSRMLPEKLHSMLVSSKDDTHQPSDVDSFGLVYAGIYCFAIPAGATRGPAFHYVMGGGWELCTQSVIVKRICDNRHRGEPTNDLTLN